MHLKKKDFKREKDKAPYKISSSYLGVLGTIRFKTPALVYSSFDYTRLLKHELYSTIVIVPKSSEEK